MGGRTREHPLHLEALYFEGCPNHDVTLELVRAVAGDLGVEVVIREIAVETVEDAERLRFLGSPTIRVNGKDIEPSAHTRRDFSLSCRVYTGGTVPPRELILTALWEAGSLDPSVADAMLRQGIV